MELVGACRDTLRVVLAERGAKPDELREALDEVEILSGKIDELWHDGWHEPSERVTVPSVPGNHPHSRCIKCRTGDRCLKDLEIGGFN